MCYIGIGIRSAEDVSSVEVTFELKTKRGKWGTTWVPGERTFQAEIQQIQKRMKQRERSRKLRLFK